MNKQRRQDIEAIKTQLADLASVVEELVSGVEAIRDEEQEYFDNMPEAFQYAEKGELAQAAVSALEEALSALEDFDVDAITSSLDEAAA